MLPAMQTLVELKIVVFTSPVGRAQLNLVLPSLMLCQIETFDLIAT